jgi:ankyrin repeat protein
VLTLPVLLGVQGEQTPLHLAAELDAVDCIKVLLSHGANMNAQDGQMLTPLLGACAGNCQKASKALMEAGASLTIADEEESTPLHWLTHHDAVELVKLALKKGAQIDALNARSETALLTAAKLGKRKVVELLLKEGATVERDSVGSIAPTNKTACHFAMQYGADGGSNAADACAILSAILKKKPDINAIDGEKRSALHYVSAAGPSRLALLLPRVLASDTSPTSRPKPRARPAASLRRFLLHRFLLTVTTQPHPTDPPSPPRPRQAVVKDDLLPAVQALIAAGAAVGQPDWSGQTPIHWACFLGASSNLKALIDAGAPADAVDDHGRTGLHRAAERDNEACVAMLLDGGKVNVDAGDVDGYSALHYAARAGALSCVKRLLQGGANRHLASASGACPADLTTDKEIHELLWEDQPGLKRQRVGSSTNLMLPELGSKFYAACAAKQPKAVLALCTPEVAKKQKAALEALAKKPPAVGLMHVSARTSTLAVEHADGLHLLGFTETGLLHSFRAFTEAGGR